MWILAPCTQQPLRPPVITPSPNYRIGTYELSVTVAGFKKYVRTGIGIEAYAIDRIDPVLAVGAATESVVVNAESPMLKTESTEVSYTTPVRNLGSTSDPDASRRASRFREQQRAGKYQEPAGGA